MATFMYRAHGIMPWDIPWSDMSDEERAEREARWRAEYEEREVTASPDAIDRAQRFWAEYRAISEKYGADYDPEGEVVLIDGVDILDADYDDDGKQIAMKPIVRRQWVRRDTAPPEPIVEYG